VVAARTSSIIGEIDGFWNGRQRREQQDDSQVCVRADDSPSRLDRGQNGAANSGGARLIKRLGDRHGAHEKINEMEPGQVGIPVHVSWLAGGHLQ
jgi:hypothetical protein